jgi:heme/copper-type cytochrome/quinol oxidase subunit 2
MQILQVVTSTVPQITAITTQPVVVTAGAPSASNVALPIAIVAIVIAALVVFSWSKRRRRREDSTRMY